MALSYCKLCSLLLTEHFGEVIGKVADDLQWGPKLLPNIVSSTGLNTAKVKKALAILIQYGFVMYEKSKCPWRAEYIYLPEKVLLLLRYQRYLELIDNKYGNESRMLLEEIMKHGSSTESSAILKAVELLKSDAKSISDCVVALRNKFHNLITSRYLIRCANPCKSETAEEPSPSVPRLVVNEVDLHRPAVVDVNVLCNAAEGQPHTAQHFGDANVRWRLNYDRFHQDMRDEVMIDAMKRRFDDNAGELMKQLLQLMYLRTEAWCSDSNPVPVLELKDAVAKKSANPYLTQYFEQYLKIMEEDSCRFLTKVGTGDVSNSQLCVNMAKAFLQLTSTAIENVVEQRFGMKAARIFRLVKTKKFVEQEQIQQLAMISDKEAKQITYKLLQENFLQMQELRKPAAGSGPNKSFFLFHVDLNLVVHTVSEMCHKAIYNALIRSRSELTNHKRLMEKHERLEAASELLREQGTDQEQIDALVDEWLSLPERNLLESVKKSLEKLKTAEIQIDNTLFLLQLYTYYQHLTMPKFSSKKKSQIE
ncbi:DNA-directed RNA polymerase III subunit RPC3 [Nilaparvata lugens]|uniref:DNA-directed RNA polymerase III subunit RPC3 n=1 Tax=Nilaparvata lugens TaxID=108931 RepID=UPI00193DD756|nr:DNA-directed RNA polymerase III subunit RPC3 [Nilaparvata lugens]